MPNLQEKLTRLCKAQADEQAKKKERRQVESSRMSEPVANSEGPTAPPSPVIVDLDHQEPPSKRTRVEGSPAGRELITGIVHQGTGGSMITLSRVWSDNATFIAGLVVSVFEEDALLVKQARVQGRRNAIFEVLIGAMKDLSLAAVLNEESSNREGLEAENSRISNELSSLKDKLEIQAGWIMRAIEAEAQVKTLTENHAKSLEEARTINVGLQGSAGSADPEESAEISNLSRADLVKLNKELGEDMMKLTPATFKNALEQVKFANPSVELNLEGLHYLKSVKDGELFTPSDFIDDDSEDGP